MPDALLFDLDGTLADTALDLGGALNQLRRELGLDELPQQQLRPHTSNGVRGLLAAGLGVTPEHQTYAAHAARFLEIYEQGLCVKTVLFDGVASLLQSCDAAGVAWGIVTNKLQRYTVPLVQQLGLARRAACIVSGDSARRPKPAATPLLMGARLAGLSPERCFYVGDDLRDIRAAHAAGMESVAAAYGYLGSGPPLSEWGADHVVHSVDEIYGLIAGSR